MTERLTTITVSCAPEGALHEELEGVPRINRLTTNVGQHES